FREFPATTQWPLVQAGTDPGRYAKRTGPIFRARRGAPAGLLPHDRNRGGFAAAPGSRDAAQSRRRLARLAARARSWRKASAPESRRARRPVGARYAQRGRPARLLVRQRSDQGGVRIRRAGRPFREPVLARLGLRAAAP